MTATGRTRDGLRAAAIRILTQAARQTSDGGEPLDFADFLTSTLISTAANLGGPDQLLAGQPGSWKANCLRELIHSAADWDHPASTFRTERILVPLNVAALMADRNLHPGIVTLDDAIELIDHRYRGLEDTEPAREAWILEVEALSQLYESRYELYAQDFTSAAQLIGRVVAPFAAVRVIADTSAAGRWWDEAAVANPIAGDADPLAVTIWQAAHDIVALPNIDVRIASGAQSQHSKAR